MTKINLTTVGTMAILALTMTAARATSFSTSFSDQVWAGAGLLDFGTTNSLTYTSRTIGGVTISSTDGYEVAQVPNPNSELFSAGGLFNYGGQKNGGTLNYRLDFSTPELGVGINYDITTSSEFVLGIYNSSGQELGSDGFGAGAGLLGAYDTTPDIAYITISFSNPSSENPVTDEETLMLYSLVLQPSATPEPGSLALCGLGGLGLFLSRRAGRKQR